MATGKIDLLSSHSLRSRWSHVSRWNLPKPRVRESTHPLSRQNTLTTEHLACGACICPFVASRALLSDVWAYSTACWLAWVFSTCSTSRLLAESRVGSYTTPDPLDFRGAALIDRGARSPTTHNTSAECVGVIALVTQKTSLQESRCMIQRNKTSEGSAVFDPTLARYRARPIWTK